MSNLTREELAAEIRSVVADAPYLHTGMLGLLAQALDPPGEKPLKPGGAAKLAREIVELGKEPEPPDGWRFLLNEAGEKVRRAPKKGEWYLSVGGEARLCQAGCWVLICQILTRAPDPEGWLAEFYPRDASEVPAGEAMEHSEQKFIGARKENLEKHGLTNLPMKFGNTECALCQTHRCNGYHNEEESRPFCPLPSCYNPGSPYQLFTDSNVPEPMIAALREAIRRRDEKAKPEKLNPGEFFEYTITGELRECVGCEEFVAAGGLGQHGAGTVYSLDTDGNPHFCEPPLVYIPWQPKVGEEVWAYINDRLTWKRVLVNWVDTDSYGLDGGWYWNRIKLRPLAFPPENCCKECGAKQ